MLLPCDISSTVFFGGFIELPPAPAGTLPRSARTVQKSNPMRISAPAILGLLLCAVCAPACASKRSQPVAKAAPPVAVAVVAEAAPGAAPDTEKRPRLGDAAVYVDGQSRGVLRRLELPEALKSHLVVRPGGENATRYYFAEYAKALGIDPLKVRGLHLYGGSRVSVVDQAEFRRIGDKLAFSFSQDDRGKPRARWPAIKLNVNTAIDMLSAVAFYVDKEPPRLNVEDGTLSMPDGSAVEGKVPYAPSEQGNGTRVYMDGALVGTVKRKKLTDDLIAPNAGAKDSDPASFSLVAYASTLGIDAKRVKAMDIISGDDVIARLDSAGARKVTFRVPSRNRGQANVEVPSAEPEGKARVARVSAVQFFVKSAPPQRTIAPIDEVPDATPSPAKSGGGGGSDDE